MNKASSHDVARIMIAMYRKQHRKGAIYRHGKLFFCEGAGLFQTIRLFLGALMLPRDAVILPEVAESTPTGPFLQIFHDDEKLVPGTAWPALENWSLQETRDRLHAPATLAEV